jgi:hypothetical protein
MHTQQNVVRQCSYSSPHKQEDFLLSHPAVAMAISTNQRVVITTITALRRAQIFYTCISFALKLGENRNQVFVSCMNCLFQENQPPGLTALLRWVRVESQSYAVESKTQQQRTTCTDPVKM